MDTGKSRCVSSLANVAGIYELILSCLATAGCGKTYLLSHIIESIHTQYFPIYYYFDAKTRGDQQWAIALVRSLIYQLLRHQPVLVKHIEDFYFNSAARTIEDFEDFSAFFEIFQKMCSCVGRIVCFVDALDECRSPSAHREVLFQKLIEMAEDPGQNFKLLVTSRDSDVKVQRYFEKSLLINVTNDDVDADISKYLDFRIRNTHAAHLRSDGLREEIQTKLSVSADGMFLWASFMFDDLESQDSVAAVRRALEDLPRRLQAIYTSALERINTAHPITVQFSRFALSWLVDGFQTLTLKELEEACQIQLDSRDLDPNSKPFDMELALKRSCGPFVRVHNDTSVSLSHFSAKEFLIAERQQPSASFLPAESSAHCRLGLLCAAYLYLNSISKGKEKLYRNPCASFPFLGYATRYWHSHILKSTSLSDDDHKKLICFLQSKNFLIWITQYHTQVSGRLNDSYSIMQLKAIICNIHAFLVSSPSGPYLSDWAKEEDQVQLAFEEYMNDAKRLLGDKSEEAMSSTMSLARLHADHLNNNAAERLFQQGISDMETKYGLHDTRTLFANIDYARHMQDVGNMVESTRLYDSILTRLRSSLGNEHPLTIRTVGHLAYHNTIIGNSRLAQEMFEEHIALCEKAFGELDPNTLEPLTCLGWCLTSYGKWQEAEKYLQLALEKTRKAFGSQHPFVATCLFNLGWLRLCQGNKEDSERLLNQSLEMRAATLGRQHRETHSARCGLACLLVQKGGHEEAVALFKHDLIPEKHLQRVNHIFGINVLPSVDEPWIVYRLMYERTIEYRQNT